MRWLTTHHDGHALNDETSVRADDPGPGGASHEYTALVGGEEVLRIQFQRGARDEAGSVPGVLDAVLLAIVADRMAAFGAGPYPSRESALVRTKCEEALHWLRARADERAARGVLGKEQR